jgi:hypothetical protein
MDFGMLLSHVVAAGIGGATVYILFKSGVIK